MPPRSYRFSSVWHLVYNGVNNAASVKRIQSPVYLRDTPPLAYSLSASTASVCAARLKRRRVDDWTRRVTYYGRILFTVKPLQDAAARIHSEEWKRVTDVQKT
jgi:hypothetical protein